MYKYTYDGLEALPLFSDHTASHQFTEQNIQTHSLQLLAPDI